MSRPTGVTMITILAFVGGMLGLCGALPVLGISLIAGVFVPPVGIIGGILGIVLAVSPILLLIFSYGAWNLRSWAWLLGIFATSYSVLSALLALFGGHFLGILSHGFLPIIIFVYLLTPGVRKAFSV